MTYGYVRCSTTEDKQDINRQIRKLKAAGADAVVFEHEHGDAKVKRNLQMLLDTAQAWEMIITLEISSLSRSTRQRCEIPERVKQQRLRLIIVGSITVDSREGRLDPMSQASDGSGEARWTPKTQRKKIGRKPTTRDDIPAVF